MSGRARLTVCAAAASVMAACALLPLATPAGWILQAAFLVALQSGVGALARRMPLAGVLTVPAQGLVSVLVLTLMFASKQAPAGFVPTPGVFARFGRLLADGVTDVGQYAIPAPVTPGIRLLLIGGVLLIALVVDALAVTYGSAAAAGLPLLALYSVAAGISGGGGSHWLWFLIAAAGYLLLLLAEGRDRSARWGRVFGGATSAGGSAAPVRTGRRIGAAALGIALAAPAMLPSLGTGLLDSIGSGTGGGPGVGPRSVNLAIALKDSLNQPEDREVLTYRTDAQSLSGMYLRIVSLDEFDGTEWRSSPSSPVAVPDVLPYPQGLDRGVKVAQVRTSVLADDQYVQGALPMPFPAEKVDVTGRWRFEPESRTIVGDQGQNTAGVSYRVVSLQVQPTAAQLAQAAPPDPQIAARYTKVPDNLPPVVAETALEVVKGAGNAYEKAVDLQRYFTSGAFTYSTQVESGTGVQAISRFLEDKQGFCVHFAFTMAAMSRTLGIPARVAVGYAPGTMGADGTVSVGLKDAHAWPELYFQGLGWTRFEPTPYRGNAPAYTQDDSTGTGGDRPDTPQHGATAAPSAGPGATPGCSPKEQALGDCGPAGHSAATAPTGDGLGAGRLAGIAVAALLVLLLPALPMLWRGRQRHRRLAGGDAGAEGDRGPGGTAARTDEEPAGQWAGDRARPAGERVIAAWQELVDTGWDYGVLPDGSETPRRTVARLVREGGLEGTPSAAAAGRLATSVERVLYAPDPPVATGLGRDVQEVRRGLHQAAGRAVRLRALLLPHSAVRVLWALSDRWSRTSQQWSAATGRAGSALRRRLPVRPRV